MKKNSRFFVLAGLFIILLATFTLIGLPFKKEESTAEEQPLVDYDKLARDLAVDRDEEYYPAYADYLCYLKGKYPKQAELVGVTKDQSGYSGVRVWQGEGYSVKALWPAGSGKDGPGFEWCWEDKELQDLVEGLIESGKEEKNGAADRIVSGNLYEITENEFQIGIDYDLTEDEVRKILEILEKDDVIKEQPDQAEIKFIMNFYDEEERERMSLGIGSDGAVYTENGEIIRDEGLQKMIGGMIKK